jgi:mannose-6-phosphate isomerase-like protein (cupin superfamily)
MHKVQKSWGHELIIENSDLYCGKKMVFHPGAWSSLHFHVKKTETIFVGKGCLTLELVEDKQRNFFRLDEGDSILITPGLVHKLINHESTELHLYEFSTFHRDDDSYRIE